jgi:acetyltransferase-like isoleucine patch superfamily enzyme/dTDP-4-dehydrorhamnose 3,5-epimerase-like enzyme
MLRMTTYFCHSQALVESPHIGEGTQIWAFAHVLPEAVIGRDCNLCDHTFVENDVILGDRVTVKCGVHLWDGTRLEDDVFIGPNAAFSNDPFPRSKQHLDEHPLTIVRRGASIAANATILPGLTIGQHAMVGAGAVVTHSVPPYAVVTGNPARIVRYTTSLATSDDVERAARGPASVIPARIRGVALHRVPLIEDLRGNLAARQCGDGIPFVPHRYFVVSDVPTREVRGEHAHRRCQQLLTCLCGSVHVVVDDGTDRQEYVLDSPELALYVPPMVWAIQYKYSPDALLLVLASETYDADDYIRDYDEFVRELARTDSEG